MKAFAYKNIDSIALESSSGGAFLRIINELVRKRKKKYSIYGAAWTSELKVKHVRITDIKNASIFCGSKYVRSDISGIYYKVLEDLRNDLFVIFTGTPCQIFGLKSFLKHKDQETYNLFTIDIICHGTPNPIVWSDCKKWLEKEYRDEVKEVTFRDKTISWKRYPTSITLQSGKKIRYTFKTELYIRMFFSLLIIENRCFSCKYSNMDRNSDITLGDFWGIDKIMPGAYSKKGISLVLANTDSGIEIMKSIGMGLKTGEVLIPANNNDFLKYQHNLNCPTEKPDGYDEFWSNYNSYGFDWVVKHYEFMSLKKCLKFYIKKHLIKFEYFDKRLS